MTRIIVIVVVVLVVVVIVVRVVTTTNLYEHFQALLEVLYTYYLIGLLCR